jgi:hypothetical protein
MSSPPPWLICRHQNSQQGGMVLAVRGTSIHPRQQGTSGNSTSWRGNGYHADEATHDSSIVLCGTFAMADTC